MLKHIGRHNDRKIVVMFHTIPNEEHMCLIVYSDLLPRTIHDHIMTLLESPVGQQATNLADALHRAPMTDGRNPLEVLHKEGYLKKIQTSQVLMTPKANAVIRLDELNTILSEMAKGEEATTRLAEIDKANGLQNKKNNSSKTASRDVGEPAKLAKTEPTPTTLQASEFAILTDAEIASHKAAQAIKMRADAASLLAEAARLESEVAGTRAQESVVVVKTPAKKAGRPKKVKELG
jgi:hypothetical protein